MATNFVQEGNVIDWYNGTGSDVDSGALVQVGFRGMGVALGDIASTATGSVMIDGVFDLALDASDTTTIGRRRGGTAPSAITTWPRVGTSSVTSPR